MVVRQEYIRMIDLIQWRSCIRSWNSRRTSSIHKMVTTKHFGSCTSLTGLIVVSLTVLLLILLQCGDIETNPGPPPPKVGELDVALESLVNWKIFSTQLPGIDPSDSDKIDQENKKIDDKKHELYTLWLRRYRKSHSLASWKNITDALKKIGENNLAYEIETKYNNEADDIVTHRDMSPQSIVTTDSDIEQRRIVTSDWECPDIESYAVLPKGLLQLIPDSGGTSYDNLAIVITNTYEGTNRPLEGVKIDRKELYETFDRDNVDLVKVEDCSHSEMMKLLDEVVPARPLSEYKCVFIVFSGHGGLYKGRQVITSNDSIQIDVENEFIQKFINKIGKSIPKIFLIDACRGNKERPVKGGLDDTNCLVAYGTQKDYVSYADEIKGSPWITCVARLLREDGPLIVKNVIEKANEEICKQRQQRPEISPDYSLDNPDTVTLGQPRNINSKNDMETSTNVEDAGLVKQRNEFVDGSTFNDDSDKHISKKTNTSQEQSYRTGDINITGDHNRVYVQSPITKQ